MKKKATKDEKMQPSRRNPNGSLPKEIWPEIISWVIHDDMIEWQNLYTVSKGSTKQLMRQQYIGD